jgi:cyanophycin synthetase
VAVTGSGGGLRGSAEGGSEEREQPGPSGLSHAPTLPRSLAARLVAHLLGRTGRAVGMACAGGVYFAGRRAEARDGRDARGARAVLTNPLVEAAVLEVAGESIRREGLGFDLCDVAVVTAGERRGVSPPVAGRSAEELARAERTVVEVVKPGGAAVLRADDPLSAAMAGHCRGSVVYFARDADVPAVARHRAAGGRAAFVRGGALVFAEGDREWPLVLLDRVPVAAGGEDGAPVEDVLAAAAAGWALGLPREALAEGLESFPAEPR